MIFYKKIHFKLSLTNMYDLININGFIILTPQEFNNDWKSTLAEKTKKKYLGCTNSYGYIIKITKISNDIETIFDSNSVSIRCNITFEVKRIKPEKNKKLNCNVNMIFNHGIFAEIDDKIKILIPDHTLKTDGYQFDKTDNVYNGNNTTIKKHDKIVIEIIDIRYNNNKYDCIGKLSNLNNI